MINAPNMLTNPAAGVIATRPATPPEIAPKTVGFPTMNVSSIVHTINAVAADTLDTIIAFAARPFAAQN